MSKVEADIPIEEEHLFDGKLALIIGGASGTGEATTRALALRGAHALTTSRTAEKLVKLRETIDVPDRIHPVTLDTTQPEQIAQLQELLQTQAIRPDFLIMASAGGLEPLMMPLLKFMLKLGRLDADERTAKFGELRALIAELTEKHSVHKRAIDVNFTGNQQTLTAVEPFLADNAKVVYYSSGPSTFAEQVPVPSFYQWVAFTKRMFEMELAGMTPTLAKRGITTSVVTGGLLSDTAMGQLLISKGLPLLGDATPFSTDYVFPTTDDMVNATLGVLRGKPNTNLDAPLYQYVTGRNIILDNVEPGDPRMSLPLPF